MSIRLNPWMRCECGKIHLRAYVWSTSVCSCGRNLGRQVWGRAS